MGLDGIRALLDTLSTNEAELYGHDFLLTWEQNPAQLAKVLGLAEVLEDLHRAGIATKIFQSGLGMSIFRDKSTRTRYAFRSGCNLLGLATEEMAEEQSQVGHGETVRETAAMIAFLSEVIGIRDDMFLGHGHSYMQQVAASLQESHEAGVLAARTTVINLQCDLDHPTQSLADLRHLTRTFGSLEALRGKKIAMTWAYSPSYGKPLSVPQGIVALMSRMGMEVVLAHPPGYELDAEPLDAARRFAAQSGGSFTQAASMEEAFAGADIVYPKSWAPLAVMRERTELLRQGGAGTKEALAQLEQRCLAQNAAHKSWEANAEKMALTKGGDALYMHCLPADISGVSCTAGEVAAEVFERYRLRTYAEASHKPFVIAAMIAATRLPDPVAALRACLAKAEPRRLGENCCK